MEHHIVLRAVVKKELLSHLVSFRFQTSGIVMLGLAILAGLVGTQDYAQRKDSYSQLLETHQREIGKSTVYSILYPVVFKAPEPLGVLDSGFDTRLGNQVTLDIFNYPLSAAGGSSRELWISVGDFDLTTTVRVVLGLLALLLTFDAVSGERERDTLRLILSNNITRSTILFGKFLGAFLALLIPLIASLGVNLLLLIDQGQVTLDSGRWLRVGGLLCGYVGYLVVMLLIGIHLSILARSSSASLVSALVCWLIVVFLIPQSAIALASVAVHENESPELYPSLTAVLTERDQVLNNLRAELSPRVEPPFQAPVIEQTARRGELLRFGSPDLYARKTKYFAREAEIGMEHADRIARASRREDERLRQAEKLAWFLAFPSPAFLLDRVSESLAGTSFADHEQFLEDARNQREVFIEFLEREQAFSSWKWFTDDRPDSPQPWTTLLGYRPEEVESEELEEQLMERFRSSEVQTKIWRLNRKFDSAPDRKVDLNGLPEAELSILAPQRAVSRVSAEFGTLACICLFLALAAGYRFHGTPLK